ncbi:MAG TPA: M66 family metalloprotease [Polyangiaceae bacterium]|nr:M66 family metalloprotease [Polyangiaceae bacterium]
MRSRALVVAGLVACGTANSRSPHEPGDGGSAGDPIDGQAGARFSEGGSEHERETGEAGAHEGGAGGAGQADVDGSAGSRDCDPSLPVDSADVPRARGLELHQIAVFQGVKVPIMELGYELSSRQVNLVTGRPALLRAYVEPADGWKARVVTARLILDEPALDEPQVHEQSRLILGVSNDAQLASTFNFEIAADLITENTAYSIELLEAEPCLSDTGDDTAARFPNEAEAPLGALPGALLQIQIVPIESDTGSVMLAPDTSEQQLEGLRAQVMRLFPISELELTLREQPLTATGTTMVEVLDQVAALRETENPAPNVVYYGLVRLTETREQYCTPSCVLGASFNGELPAVGVGVGIGYTGDESARAFAHELGHVYGRPHTPCGVAGDAGYPYSGGRIGSWGYDVDRKILINPDTYTDFMGYCQPSWVSDHTYEHLRDFIAHIESPVQAVEAFSVGRAPNAEQGYRSLVIQPGKPPAWGRARRLRGNPGGMAELAQVFDASGHGLSQGAAIFRRRVADVSAEIVYIPEWACRSGASLQLGQERIRLPSGCVP